MKTTQIIPILLLLLFSCKKSDTKENDVNKYAITCLTNDSIKYWESYPPINNYQQGYYFSKDGTCDKLDIDESKGRLLEAYDDIVFTRPLRFTIYKDTLEIFSTDGDLFNRFRVLKLDQNHFIVREISIYITLSNDTSRSITITKFIPSLDQKTKPIYPSRYLR